MQVADLEYVGYDIDGQPDWEAAEGLVKALSGCRLLEEMKLVCFHLRCASFFHDQTFARCSKELACNNLQGILHCVSMGENGLHITRVTVRGGVVHCAGRFLQSCLQLLT
jgi:hypothetical protein